ncbi:MAG: UxaA family hydrolase [Peptococcaceae bacterium]|nr:UxaA family hydrolase [Peptococcaceae bacterium]
MYGKAVLINVKDNVATVTEDVKSGQSIVFLSEQKEKEIEALDDIPFGHKVAIREIFLGQDIIKYGEIIGRATFNIQTGQHVHVHNVEALRGRGDLGGKANEN